MKSLADHLIGKALKEQPRGIVPETATLVVKVAPYGDIYAARCNGKRATSTSMEIYAVKSAAHKAGLVLLEGRVIDQLPAEKDLDPIRVSHGVYHVHLGKISTKAGK